MNVVHNSVIFLSPTLVGLLHNQNEEIPHKQTSATEANGKWTL